MYRHKCHKNINKKLAYQKSFDSLGQIHEVLVLRLKVKYPLSNILPIEQINLNFIVNSYRNNPGRDDEVGNIQQA